MAFAVERLVRDNIKRLVPYSSARGEFSGDAAVFLDANENAFGSPVGQNLHRYPDTMQSALKQKIGQHRSVRPSQIFVGNGSDEAIDLLFRVFCRPAADSVLICPPTYGMYETAAAINDIAVLKARLTADFELDFEKIKAAAVPDTKLIFLCSPNNPTGNLADRRTLLSIVEWFDGIVVVDEAYIDFAAASTLAHELDNYPNLVVLQTLSKAWGLAGLRVGLALASEAIIDLLNKVKPPYNVGKISQDLALAALENSDRFARTVAAIVKQRGRLAERLKRFSFVEKVFPSDANFLLVRVRDARTIYKFLLGEQIVIRDRSSLEGCAETLRITVGTEDENATLVAALKNYEKSIVYRP